MLKVYNNLHADKVPNKRGEHLLCSWEYVLECFWINTFWLGILILSNQVLAHGLEVNSTLNTLAAGDNPLTTTGCMDIIDAVCNNSSLMNLNLQVNNVAE